jgi:hypothetical protein
LRLPCHPTLHQDIKTWFEQAQTQDFAGISHSYDRRVEAVKAGLVQRPEDWEFSSYQDYVDLRHGTLPQWGDLRQQIGSADDYRAFVEGSDNLIPPMVQHLMLDE